MKHLYLAILFASVTGFAQNLVPNPSFELMSQCPNAQGQADFATGWFKSTVNNIPPSHADYMNTCGTGYSVPSNPWGTETPATGNGYMAITTKVPSLGPNYRENIYAQLNTPLVVNQRYDLSFKLSLCDYFQYSSNKMGLKFSNSTNISVNNTAHLFAANQVTLQSGWVTISGEFVADSAYNYIGVGNFFDDANTTEMTACSSCAQAYNIYYVDDISVTLHVSTGLKENKLEKVSIYPNPSTGKINLAGLTYENYDISVFNAIGKKVFSANNKTMYKNEIDLGNEPKGLYFIEITADNSTITRKLVID